MIYLRREGEVVRNGFNIWSFNDPNSRGFIFRLGKWMFRCRYSLNLKEWIIYSSWQQKDGFWYGKKPKEKKK